MKLSTALQLLFTTTCLSLSLFAQVREPKKPVSTIVNSVVKSDSEKSDSEKPDSEKPEVENPETAVEKPSETPKPIGVDGRENRYRIGLLDQIEVSVSRHPELSMIVAVNEQGMISLPRAEKSFAVVCKTESELQIEIAKEYSKFLRQPFVNVRVTQQNSQPFAVIGAVEKPSNFFLNRRIRLLELISYAGGPKVEKAGTKVQIARVGGVSGCTQTEVADASDFDTLFETYSLKDVYDLKKNPWMRPGDIVRVLESDEVYVIGNVFKPQAVIMKDGLTVTQAIAAAGGTLSSTKKDKIEIRRQINGIKETILVDLDKINKKQLDDISLLPDDIIDVPTSASKQLLTKIFQGFTQGIPNVVTRVP
jgi:polysaccharide biosynthesis/export protein